MDPSEKRTPKTFVEGVMSTIPGLRDQVPNQPEGFSIPTESLNWLRENGYEPKELKAAEGDTPESLKKKNADRSDEITAAVPEIKAVLPKDYESWPLSRRKIWLQKAMHIALAP
jgi:hypothetical protein